MPTHPRLQGGICVFVNMLETGFDRLDGPLKKLFNAGVQAAVESVKAGVRVWIEEVASRVSLGGSFGLRHSCVSMAATILLLSKYISMPHLCPAPGAWVNGPLSHLHCSAAIASTSNVPTPHRLNHHMSAARERGAGEGPHGACDHHRGSPHNLCGLCGRDRRGALMQTPFHGQAWNGRSKAATLAAEATVLAAEAAQSATRT